MIDFQCENCGKKIRVKDELAGRTGKCAGCGLKISIPNAIIESPLNDSLTPLAIAKPKSLAPTPPPLIHTQPSPTSNPGVAVQVNVDSSPMADGLGISSLIIGILSFLVCWIPLINFGMGGLGLLLGIAGIVMAVQRKGQGVGYSIAGTAVSTISFLLGILYLTVFASILSTPEKIAGKPSNSSAEGTSQSPYASTAASQDNSSPLNSSTPGGGASNASKWTIVPAPITLGRVTLDVTEAKIGKVPYVGPLTDSVSFSKEDYLLIRVKIRNNDPNRKIDYRSWSNTLASLAGIEATLSDEFGNKYKYVRNPAAFEIQDTAGGESIYPQKEIRDAVVFETPVPNATKFFLTLSAVGCEEKGEFQFEIPREFTGNTNAPGSSNASSPPENLPAGTSAIPNQTKTSPSSPDTIPTPPQPTTAPPTTSPRNTWVNDTYKSRIVRVGAKKWQELTIGTNELVWNYDELGETPEYLEVFLVERNQKGRLYNDRIELFINNNWVNAAQGRWER